MAARAIGFYAKGCLAGAAALPIDGPAWQAMRLSRNRNWGHPKLVALVEKLAIEAKQHDGWPGLLVGDLSQPRGGPMLTGHASHQVGLDADIWLTPMPDRRLTEQEREDLSATSMLAADQGVRRSQGVDRRPRAPPQARRLLRRAWSAFSCIRPSRRRCARRPPRTRSQRGPRKIRAYWGHHYHFHVRIACPEGSTNCEAQPPLPADDGCGAELKRWLALVKPKPQPTAPTPPGKPRPVKPGITLDQLPAECRTVLSSGTDAPVLAATPGKPAQGARGSQGVRHEIGRTAREGEPQDAGAPSGRAAISRSNVVMVDWSMRPSTRSGRKWRWKAVTTNSVLGSNPPVASMP